MFEDDETLQMYIEESLDHLGDIESDLLEIEESGSDIDLDLVNNVFRAAHSVKGGAGFMGLQTIKDLAHHLENVLGLIRTKELVPDSNKINILLKGFDKLETLLNDIENSNEADISEHVTALEKIVAGGDVEESGEAPSKSNIENIEEELFDIVLKDGRKLEAIPSGALNQAFSDGKNIFLAEYDIAEDIVQKGRKTDDIIKTLNKSGIVIDSRILPESASQLENDPNSASGPFQVLFASIVEQDMTETLCGLTSDYIYQVEDVMVQRSNSPEQSTMPMPQKLKTENISVPVEAPAISSAATQTQEAKAPVPQAKKTETAKTETKEASSSASKGQTSLRVNVGLLDTLMTLAGELVLSRNQLLQGVNSSNPKATELSSQRIDMITSELQEAIMRTRMQPIANVFNKFTRVVRDLSQQLGKSIDLIIEGKEVELDKTILESINDPLTHLVRNSIDHGIEPPDERERMGKSKTGKIYLKAFHDAGQVNIVISDDGKGLAPEKIASSALSKGLVTEQQIADMSDKSKMELIFLPGFSTAKEITDVSGRGVGMDVVITNIESLGGIIELDSTPGKGTDIQIKLPLTLAIIPSQITSVGNERYALPQVNLNELLRIPAAHVKEKIERVGDADVVRLRGELLPLLNLSKVLGIEKTYVDPDTNDVKPDRRENLADRRSGNIEEESSENEQPQEKIAHRIKQDRRYHAASAINIAVVAAGPYKYGLVVDQLHDSEEIVVKPVGRHLKKCTAYAGATIMGDGKVALILDISNLAQIANLASAADVNKLGADMDGASVGKDTAALLTFKNGENEYFAAPLSLVERIERIHNSDIELIGDKKVVQYRGGSLPLYELTQVADFENPPNRDQREVVVFNVKHREIGLLVSPPVDALEMVLKLDQSTLKQTAISGSMIINGHTTLLVDIFEMVRHLNPEWFQTDIEIAAEMAEEGEKVILFAEDSAFFRAHVKSFMEEDGFKVLEAEDGQIAWELLKDRVDDIDLVVTDLEMPNMDGFELTQNIKNDPLYSHLTVVALTSLASEAHIKKGKEVGIDDYQIKLDRERLMDIVRGYLGM